MNIKDEILKVIEIESKAAADIKKRVDAGFEKAVNVIKDCTGKVVVVGIGKSGLIGQKISATLSSTGTPSMFLHPVEAVHGDMGIIAVNDVVLILSQSGETEEIIEFLAAVRRMQVPVLAITGKKDSTLGKSATCLLDSSVKKEACPMGLAPTASTTVQLVIGDSLAVALLKIKGFKKEDFAQLHPGGSLGKKLVMKVSDVMHTGSQVPLVSGDILLKEAMIEMTKKRFGCTAITDKDGKVKGIFTDGDLRRLLESNPEPFELKISEVMTKKPKTITAGELAVTALAIMEEKSITVLPVLDKEGRAEGIIHLHDILKSGVV